MIVFEQAILQGTATSRSILLPDPLTRRFVGNVFQSTLGDPLTDPAFTFTLALQWCISNGIWHQGSVIEWKFGDPLTVRWDGLARRVRLVLDPIRPCSLGMAITY